MKKIILLLTIVFMQNCWAPQAKRVRTNLAVALTDRQESCRFSDEQKLYYLSKGSLVHHMIEQLNEPSTKENEEVLINDLIATISNSRDSITGDHTHEDCILWHISFTSNRRKVFQEVLIGIIANTLDSEGALDIKTREFVEKIVTRYHVNVNFISEMSKVIPLNLVIFFSLIEEVKWFLGLGADPNFGYSPISLARARSEAVRPHADSYEVLRILEEKAAEMALQ